jgi:hypothetical protein
MRVKSRPNGLFALVVGEPTLMTAAKRRPFRIGFTEVKQKATAARKRPFSPVGGETLEGRTLCSVSNLTASASPTLVLTASASPTLVNQLNPRDQPHAVQVAVIRPVTIAGYVTDNTGATPAVSFRVIDQNGRHMPSGPIRTEFVRPSPPGPGNLFFFSKRIGLNRTRLPGDSAGRKYTILVTAQDAQNTVTVAIPASTAPAHG